MLAATRAIVGEAPGFEALSLDWTADCDLAERQIRERLAGLDSGQGVLVLTDLFGSTPFHAARRTLEPGRVELVTGMNLAMVVRLACCPPEQTTSLGALAEWVLGRGRESMRHLPAANGEGEAE